MPSIYLNHVKVAEESGGVVSLPNTVQFNNLKIGGTEVINSNRQIQNITGIDFGSSTVLNDYEEGNWSIEFVQSSDYSTKYTAATNDGRYLKIGNLIYCTMQVYDDASGSPSFSGDVLIKLPFANSLLSSPFYPTYYSSIGGINSGHIFSALRDYMTLTNNRASPLGNNVSNVTFGSKPRLFGSFTYMIG